MIRNLLVECPREQFAVTVDKYCKQGWTLISHAVFFVEPRVSVGGKIEKRMMFSLLFTKDLPNADG